MKSDSLDINGCMVMYGAHVRLCIKDYAEVYKKQNAIRRKITIWRKAHRNKPITNSMQRLNARLANFETAERFIFAGGIDEAINQYHLPLNAGYVRRYAVQCAKQGFINDRGTNTDIQQSIDNADRLA